MKNILLFLFLPLFLGACGDDDNTPNGPDENDNIIGMPLPTAVRQHW